MKPSVADISIIALVIASAAVTGAARLGLISVDGVVERLGSIEPAAVYAGLEQGAPVALAHAFRTALASDTPSTGEVSPPAEWPTVCQSDASPCGELSPPEHPRHFFRQVDAIEPWPWTSACGSTLEIPVAPAASPATRDRQSYVIVASAPAGESAPEPTAAGKIADRVREELSSGRFTIALAPEAEDRAFVTEPGGDSRGFAWIGRLAALDDEELADLADEVVEHIEINVSAIRSAAERREFERAGRMIRAAVRSSASMVAAP